MKGHEEPKARELARYPAQFMAVNARVVIARCLGNYVSATRRHPSRQRGRRPSFKNRVIGNGVWRSRIQRIKPSYEASARSDPQHAAATWSFTTGHRHHYKAM